ncbi:carbohydrate ABC transporter permease [Paenibacillus thiaminolyticus]|uniref:Carbohydrate ABC transporter permease n=3 Tax=Paenibacillus thiaminolyticus TaxID=49283 RepID=A0AAP9DY56_PANTH|nr:carbohydrate ABC transporter permease [Paenibacillus thiaminolyticus]MCY9536173.1 carbohydrate ABC transporter permease [Paenibacillus thiaminolyticus]MCY9603562.1 carbohydrate ABC transporter permease [Paenibacillus thiaminolyticus]MCY9605696.1 carbohydrate ABC transporter permease [Paenibacillus thiaminolyticus]MCY9611803.1 carbohydrate ABC transporter permease [Paenibacillus thiaminolyticus]MCY9620998.1 carbohydrate ABC transporter permease [Paenibacillus thiaminolyticus]
MRDNRMAGQRNRKLMYAGRLALAVIVTALLFFPVYWLIVSSLKTQQEMRLAVPTFWPQTFSWSNYAEAFRIIPYARFFGNTLLMSAGIVVLQLNVALLAAFAFAKGRFRGKEVLFFLVLAAMIVPDQVTFVPVYVMMSKLNWLDTFWALIIPHGASAYGIFLLRQAFKSVNNDVLEAARVDGGGRLTLLYRILLPMTMPTVVTLAVLQFISAWNSYFWPLIMTNSNDMRVLTVGISMLRDSIAGDEAMYFHIIMAASGMAIVPIVILFTFMQKHIVSAMANSTFK